MKVINLPFGTTSLIDKSHHRTPYALLLHYKKLLKEDRHAFMYHNYILPVISTLHCSICGKPLTDSAIIKIQYSKEELFVFGVDTHHMCSKSCISTFTNKQRMIDNPQIHINMIAAAALRCKGLSLNDKVGKERADEIRKILSENMTSDNIMWSKKYNTTDDIKSKKNAISKRNSIRCKDKSLDEIYGKEMADIMRSSISAKVSGIHNPMYGRSPGKNAGRGISGHFRGHHFRSLLELSFMYKLYETGINFIGAEKTHSVKYELDGKCFSYRPDFYLSDTDDLIEIKQSWALNLPENIAKFSAALKKYPRFKVITEKDIEKISTEQFTELLLNEHVVFDDHQLLRAKSIFKVI